MNFVDVHFHGLDQDEPVLLGRLAYDARRRCAQFEMDPGFLRHRINPSPLQIERKPGLQAAPLEPFGGLHGLFADSLPDRWGRRIMDKAFTERGIDPDRLTPIDRLAFIGSRGMGALSYTPDTGAGTPAGARLRDLAEIGREATRQYQGSAGALAAELIRHATPSGGAHPKILAGLKEGGAQALAGADDLPDGYRHWIVKFPVGDDPFDKAAGAVEFLFSQMAKKAGVEMMPTRLLPGKRGHAYFATQRFDRLPSNRRRHVHTVAGLLHADYRVAAIDYLDLLKLSDLLTRSHAQKVEAFRRMAFNVIAGNRDDHAKNFAFMMSPGGEWRHTPAYDITFNLGGGTPVAGKSENLAREDLLGAARQASIPRAVAEQVVEEVCDALSDWGAEARNYPIPKALVMTIGGYFERSRKRMRASPLR